MIAIDPTFHAKMIRRIVILAYPNVQLLDMAGPLQVFASVNDLNRAEGKPLAYELVVVGEALNTVTSCGLSLSAQPLAISSLPLDTLVIPGGWGVNAACEQPELVKWVRDRSKEAKRTVSVCSGAFLLAETGLLEGRRAVTHWQRCEEFSRRFPGVKLDPDPIFINDGPIWTSAGVTAGIDLALALVEADMGRETALAVARQLVVFLKRPGGQSQFSAALTLQDNGGRFDQLHTWLGQNLQRPLTLADLAEHAGMSQRNFSRKYHQETGQTPGRALEGLRLEQARRLLEQGLHVSRVTQRCGFGTEETMRRTFLRRLGTTPQAYRERFSG